MVAFNIVGVTPDWMAAKWLFWICLYLSLGVCVPWVMARSWAHQHQSNMAPRIRQVFQSGELGLVSLMLAISVIWDLQKSQLNSYTIALGSVFLAMTGIMAASVWVESFCRRTSGAPFSPDRAWRDSRNLSLLVFSLTIVTEILLDRVVKVTTL